MKIQTMACGALVALALAGPALAQETPSEIARRDLIAQAEQARTAGDHARALDLATRAGRLRMTPSLRLLIAAEHLTLEHWLEASNSAGHCRREAEGDATMNNRAQVLEGCGAIERQARAHLGQLVVRAPDPAPPGLAVRVGDTALDAALWGIAYPVVPGTAVVEATASDGSTFRSEVTVAAGESRDVVVALVPPERPPAPAPVEAVVVRRPPPPPVRRGPGVTPWIVAGGGVVAFGLAGVFYALREGARSDRDAACDPAEGCFEVAQDHEARFRSFTVLTDVALGVGVAAVAGGVLWWVLGRPGREAPRVTLDVAPSPGAQGLTLGVRGAL